MGMPLTRRSFTVDEYHRMAEAGILGEDDRVELIDGQVVAMTPIGPAHASCVNRLTALFAPLAGRQATLSVQNPVVLGEHEEPISPSCGTALTVIGRGTRRLLTSCSSSRSPTARSSGTGGPRSRCTAAQASRKRGW